MGILERAERDLEKAIKAGDRFLERAKQRRPKFPPYSRSLSTRPHDIWVYLGGVDLDLAWRLARFRAGQGLGVLLIPFGHDLENTRWPNLHGAEALLVCLPGAWLSLVPHIALALFDARAGIVRALDTERGAMAVYRREA